MAYSFKIVGNPSARWMTPEEVKAIKPLAVLGLRDDDAHMDILACPYYTSSYTKKNPKESSYVNAPAIEYTETYSNELTAMLVYFVAHSGWGMSKSQTAMYTYNGGTKLSSVLPVVTITDNEIQLLAERFSQIGDSKNPSIQLYSAHIKTVLSEVKPTIRQLLTNCASSLPAESIAPGDAVTITLTAEEFYRFETAPTARDKVTNETYTATLSDDGTTAILEIASTRNDIEVIATASRITYSVSVEAVGCICTVSNCIMNAGDILSATVTPLQDFEVLQAPTLVENGVTYQFTETSDGRYRITHTIRGNIVITASAMPESNNGYGFIKVYTVDNRAMETLGNELLALTYKGAQVDSMPQGWGFYPLSAYVFSLQAFHLEIPTAAIERIRIGSYLHEAEGGVPKSEWVDVDCGSIEISETYHNALDYSKYSKTTIVLPFCGQYTLDTDRYMGQTVHLRYRVNLVNGDCTATLENSQGLTELYTGKASFNVPIATFAASQGVDSNTQYLYQTKPFIVIETAKPLEDHEDDSPEFGRNADYIARLGDLRGYTECDEVALVTCDYMLKNDIQLIKSYLREGVIL